MSDNQFIKGFNKLNRDEKIKLLANTMEDTEAFVNELKTYRFQDTSLQQKYEQFSENTISNFHLPYGIAPNFLIDGKVYHVPMVTEESSVIAAASKASKFCHQHGGFRTEKIGTAKRGHVHVLWFGEHDELESLFKEFEADIKDKLADVTRNMDARGGGINETWITDMTSEMDNYYLVGLSFETGDSMGANFINSVLEKTAQEFKKFTDNQNPEKPEILMAILSNHEKLKAFIEGKI